MSTVIDKIYNYFERNPQLHVLFIFDKMDIIQTELEDVKEWADGYIYKVFDGAWFNTKYAIENNLNGFYLETFLGHYVSGAEQFGTFSNLNFKEYIKTMREFLSQIAEIYGIY